MTVHAREPFSSGLRKPAQTMCGEFTPGKAPETKYDPATRSMIEVAPGVPSDRLKCLTLLAREDDRAPMGDGDLG